MGSGMGKGLLVEMAKENERGEYIHFGKPRSR
jgi:hypothetical protein